MFIIKHKQTHIVLYCESVKPVISENGLISPYSASDINNLSHEILEVNSPEFQFIPSTLKYNNGKWEISDQNLYDQIVNELSPKEPVPETISDRQFFQILAVKGLISKEEALSAVKTGDLPAAIEGFINSLRTDLQFNARMLLEGATSFNRSHPLTSAFGAMYQMTSEQIDQLWIEAAKL